MMKYCGLCELTLPLDKFHLDKSRPDGHTANCKVCRNKITKASKAKNKSRVLAYSKVYNKKYKAKCREENEAKTQLNELSNANNEEKSKYCPACDLTLTLDKYGFNKSTKDGYSDYCKECCNKNSRKYKAENKDLISAANKDYGKRVLDEKKNQQNVSKQCNGCNLTLALDKFGLAKRNNDGHTSKCKDCSRKEAEEKKKKHKEAKVIEENGGEQVEKSDNEHDEHGDVTDDIVENKDEQVENNLDNYVEIMDDFDKDTMDHAYLEVDFDVENKDMITKHCNCCDRTLSLDKFGLDNKQPDGHQYKCKECKNTSTGELVSRASCQHLFDKQFNKIRPPWLLNDKGNRLEIDMYNDELKLGVEYNGRQHYDVTHHLGKEVEFNATVAHDKIKVKTCKELGIGLIIVPYTVAASQIC